MAFQVKELMVALQPSRIACGNTEAQCPAVSALLFCGNTEGNCPTASALGFAAPDSRRNLELLRRDLAERRGLSAN
ncbi:MAG TPA: hypothetical protein VNM67_06730 [Thermoanaerobaculia bacterium]|jgi:hypothetical protein|nr:hypothetical protein [Thermoanaerobaculia bacterium]